MGFRSTIVTQDLGIHSDKIPEWFSKKYNKSLSISCCVSTLAEYKWYGQIMQNINEDFQKVCQEIGRDSIEFIWFHECGGVTKVKITKDGIKYYEPTGWEETENITHDYCYGCSDPKITTNPA